MLTLYTCNTCYKSKQFTDSELISIQPSKCTITTNCKGTLYKNTTIIDNTSIVTTPYGARKRFIEFKQVVGAYKWSIQHNLQCYPDIQIFRETVVNEKIDYVLVDSDEYVVTYSDNSLVVEFAEKLSGIAHLIAKASADNNIVLTDTPTNYIQSTANTILTIATPYTFEDQVIQNIAITSIDSITGKEKVINVPLTAHKLDSNISLFDTPWKDAQIVAINDKLFRVRSVRFATFCLNNHIADGSPIIFNSDNDNLILLSKYPYLDKIDKDHVVIPIKYLKDYTCKVLNNELTVDALASVQYSLNPIIVKTIQE